MNLTKLGSVAIRLARRNVLLQRQAIHPKAEVLHRCQSSQSSNRKDDDDDDDDLNKPIQFSTSEAATWNAMYSRTGGPIDDAPWYQGYVVLASTAAFLIYFLVLREENDIDQRLDMNLIDHFTGEQKKNLEASLQQIQNRMPSKSSYPRSS